MTSTDRALAYLSKCPSAVSGQSGHNTTFQVVASIVHGFALDESEAFSVLRDWNGNCQPPWSEKELMHKIRDASNASHDKPRGHLLGSGKADSQRRQSSHSRPVVTQPKPSPVAKKYDLEVHETAELPEPLKDGTRALLRVAFESGEGIRIVSAKVQEDGKEVPDGDGPCLSRDEWIRKLDEKDGNPNRIWKSADKAGIYITINPLKLGGSKDADVTAFRHALLEFDSISPLEQWTLYTKSRIPCTAIISSGGKSVHAWVKVDAKDRREYDERVAILYAHFAAYGLDSKNKNPSRLSRLPNCERFKKRQELLALNVGCESFSEWLGELQTEGSGDVVTVESLASFDASTDTNAMLGNRWLCRGGSLLLVGQSGTGKSSLAVQMAVTWGLGKPFFGIKPVKPFKCLFVQAENDMGDLAEMMQGVMEGMDLSAFSDEFEALKRNLIFVRDTTHTGFEFTQSIRKLIDKHKPDLVFIDPLLSFIGDDISKQSVCGQFLRNWLNPISDATGVVWIMVHHTNKPPADAKARQGWKSADYAYMGSGSSELTNWARAVMTLGMLDEGEFELKLAKRGGRAGACEPDGTPTTRLFLRHAEKGIQWLQCTAPPEPEPESKREKKQTKVKQLAARNLHEVISTIPAEGLSAAALGEQLTEVSRKLGCTVGLTKCRTELLDALIENGKLRFDAGKYHKGENA